jgi:hypothetical protein
MARDTDFKPAGNKGLVSIGPVSDPVTNWRLTDNRGYTLAAAPATSRVVTISRGGNSFTLKRAIFTFDFTGRNSGQAPNMQNVKRIASAEVSINLAGKFMGAFGCYAGVLKEIANNNGSVSVEDGYTPNILGYDDRSSLINTEFLSPAMSISGTGYTSFKLPPSVLGALANALRSKQHFGIILIDSSDQSLRSVVNAVTVSRGGSWADFSDSGAEPEIDIKYFLDDSRKNAGFNPGGACNSGFSDGANVSAGASSGFFDF